MALLALAVVPRADAYLFDHDVEVITTTRLTPEGRRRTPPTPAAPVYYDAVNLGFRQLGEIESGVKPPPNEEMLRVIFKVLAEQGYRLAGPDHPPTLHLVFVWGTMNPTIGTDEDGNDVQTNARQLYRFLNGGVNRTPLSFEGSNYALALQEGAERFSGRVMTRTELKLDTASSDGLYIAEIGAYEHADTPNGWPKLLWKTYISCPSTGLAMTDVAATMFKVAGPHIGRETLEPVWVNASRRFKGWVEVGEPVVLDYVDPAKRPVTDASQVPLPGTKRKP